jgi:hypothetical protein
MQKDAYVPRLFVCKKGEILIRFNCFVSLIIERRIAMLKPKTRVIGYLICSVLLMIFPAKVFFSGGGFSEHTREVDLPKFLGRIFLEQDVLSTGLICVEVPFEATENWGENCFMVIGKQDPSIVFKAYRMDPKTNGLLQYAEKRVNVLGVNLFAKILDARIEDGKLIVVSAPDKVFLTPLILFFAVCFLVIVIFGIESLFFGKKGKLEIAILHVRA